MVILFRKENRRKDEYVGKVTDLKEEDNIAEELRKFLAEHLSYYNGKMAKVTIEYCSDKPMIKSSAEQLSLFSQFGGRNVEKKKI